MRTDYINKADGKDKNYYLMVIDDHGYIQFANSHFITNLEICPEKIKENSFFQFIGPNHLKSFKESISHVKKTNSPVSIDISAQNGSNHWMKLEISKFKNGANSHDKYFCIGYDIVGKERVKRMKDVADQHYDAIMEGLTIGVIMQDVNGDVLAANQRAAEIFGVSIETIYENYGFKNLWNNCQDASGNLTYDSSPLVKAFQTKELQKDIRVTFRTAENEIKTLQVNSQPLFGEANENPNSVVTSITDISREKALENEVHLQDQIFRSFHNNSPNLAWVVDKDGRLFYMNQAFRSFLNLEDDVIGEDVFKILPAEVSNYFERINKKVLESGIAYKAREKYVLLDGSELIFWVSVFPIESPSDKKLLGGEAINITEQFAALQQLQNANERLSHYSSITKDAIWEWDMQTGQIFRNQTLLDLIGVSVNISYSLSWWFKRIHPEDRRKVGDAIREVIGKKLRSWESEYRFKKVTGEYISVYDKGFIIFEKEQPIKMIGSLHDISQVKELEVKLVEEKVQRQKDITETVFAVQEKERTRIGHELHDNVNQILSTCKLFMDMIKTTTAEDDDKKLKVKEYLLSAIEEIRKLSKEMVTPQLKEKGLIASIKTLVDDLNAINTMEVFFYHQEEVEVISNSKKVALFRIIQEQIKNTLKYSKGKVLTIHLQSIKNDIQLVIEDDGVGFDTKQTRRGIGLSNIFDRTRFYNGNLQIKSAPGQGCKMIVEIPAFG